MSLALTAYLNQRFAYPYDVSNYPKLYSQLAQAVWLCQIRPSDGASVVTLEFKTGGANQDPANVIVYYPDVALIALYCPTSSLVGIIPGTYSFDFGFILPGTDFERVDGGTIQFFPGSTSAGIQGSPAAPPGADATVFMAGGSIPNQVPGAIVEALAAASSSAASAASSALAATNSETAAATSAAVAQAAANTATNAAVAAEVAAAAAVFAAGLRMDTQILTVTATDTLSSLTYAWTGYFSLMFAKGIAYMTTGSGSAYEISGSTVLWHSANAGGVHLSPGDSVAIVYSY